MPDLQEKVGELQGQLASLQSLVESLRSEIADARGSANFSMRSQTRCPACRCVKILHSKKVLDSSDSGRGALSLQQPSVWSSKRVGEFEVYICTECNLAEWYADLSDVDPTDLRQFELLDGTTPGGGVYR
jgi:hypothetical protein